MSVQDYQNIESIFTSSIIDKDYFRENSAMSLGLVKGVELCNVPQVSNPKNFVTLSKHARKWKKGQAESLYENVLEYCNVNNRSPDNLTPADFEIISAGRPQTANDCLIKFFEIYTSGSFKPGVWGEVEDELLLELRSKKKSWVEIAKTINSKVHGSLAIRSGKKCKERWANHLNPDIRRGRWSDVEDIIILECHLESPKNWKAICKSLPDRTESSVKNRINSLINSANHDINCYNDLAKGIQKLLQKKRKQAQEQLQKDINSKSIKEKV